MARRFHSNKGIPAGLQDVPFPDQTKIMRMVGTIYLDRMMLELPAVLARRKTVGYREGKVVWPVLGGKGPVDLFCIHLAAINHVFPRGCG
ncbi:MAG: hypothetical protein BWY80_00931 [Firmicutes bacterium ADurb.Bin456]|nr:MAG: hypothetical protein BWY80_00931 [Firmicutes bacterium ADurb.Bin456]